MSHAFSLAQSRCTSVTDPSLIAEIREHAGSDKAAETILRSISRFGGDDTIQSFEIMPRVSRRDHRFSMGQAWTVRAVRG